MAQFSVHGLFSLSLSTFSIFSLILFYVNAVEDGDADAGISGGADCGAVVS